MFSGIDKVLHVSIFAMLGFCFMCAFPRTRVLTFIYIMLIYAFVTEILQDAMHMGRGAEVLDIVADFVGVAIGFGFFQFAKHRYFASY